MNCFLIGVSHGYQYEGNKSVDTAAFRGLLNQMHAVHRVNLLAEELNREAIENTRIEAATGSVAKNVALELNILHRFRDPPEYKRKQLGIPTRAEIIEQLGFHHLPCLTAQQDMAVRVKEKKYWGIREQYWLGKLEEASTESAIFVLGAYHVNRFKELLEKNGHTSTIYFEHWKP